MLLLLVIKRSSRKGEEIKHKIMKVACNFDNTNSILSSVVQILPPLSGTPSINRGKVILHRLGCGQSVLSTNLT